MAVRLRGGHRTEDRRLDRLPPSDWRHYDRFPLSAAPAAVAEGSGAVLGVAWYSNFDRPERVGSTWWIGRGELGRLRGGHAIFARRHRQDDPASWWEFYDQGAEGACVGFAVSRAASHLNRRRYGARWLYGEAKRIDEWAGEDYEGTSVRAGLEVLRSLGHREVYRGRERDPDPGAGIEAYRWARTWDEVRAGLGLPDTYDGVPLLNSWGRGYPHIVRITDEAGARVLEREDGEAAFLTDR